MRRDDRCTRVVKLRPCHGELYELQKPVRVTEYGEKRVVMPLSCPEFALAATGFVAPLSVRARLAMAQADSIRALLASDRTSYGRFRRDSTLLRNVSQIRSELDVVRGRLASSDGTLGRLHADSAFFVALDSAQHEMTLIMADISRRPLRYIHF